MKITAAWDPIECEKSCLFNLQKEFSSTHKVADLDIRKDSGIVTFRWLPTVPFDFTVIKRAFQLVGLGLQTVDIELRGVVKWKDDNNVTLLSIGDGTVFQLIGPLLFKQNSYVNPGNKASYPIEGELKANLQKASREQKVVVIKGTLFMPRLAPYSVSVNQMTMN